MPLNHLILCRPLLLLPSIFPSIRVFFNESVLCIRWPSIGVSALTSVLPMNIQDWSPLGWTGWISLQSKGLLGVFSNTTVQKHQFFLFCGAGQIYVHFTATTLVFIIIIGVEFPYNIVLVSAVPQPESAVSMRTPLLLTPSPPHPSRSSRSSQLSSLGYTAPSH